MHKMCVHFLYLFSARDDWLFPQEAAIQVTVDMVPLSYYRGWVAKPIRKINKKDFIEQRKLQKSPAFIRIKMGKRRSLNNWRDMQMLCDDGDREPERSGV